MVYETTCAAILHNPQTPCLVVATATSQPFLIPHLKHERAKGRRTATLGGDLSTLEFMESAGPHLILACAQPDWERTAPPQRLRDLLESLHRLSLKHSVEILVNEREVSLAPIENRESSPEELDDRQAALALVAELKSVLDQALPYYSGIVVIPSAPASGDR